MVHHPREVDLSWLCHRPTTLCPRGGVGRAIVLFSHKQNTESTLAAQIRSSHEMQSDYLSHCYGALLELIVLGSAARFCFAVVSRSLFVVVLSLVVVSSTEPSHKLHCYLFYSYKLRNSSHRHLVFQGKQPTNVMPVTPSHLTALCKAPLKN